MESEPPKSKMRMEIEGDQLASLPSDVVERILLFLLTKEVVRTSVLSKKWRYKWATLPCLVFDEQCVPGTESHHKFVKVVDHVLLLHIGPIHKVKISHPNLRATEDIDRWILHLSRYPIKEFIFEYSRSTQYKLPSSLFYCQEMNTLDLRGCLLKLPSTFMGFKSLEKLSLIRIRLSQDGLGNLIACCPLLKVLHLASCQGFSHPKIDAPNLLRLIFVGDFENLYLENTLNLKRVFIFFRKNVDQRQDSSSSSNLLKFFDQLPHIQAFHACRLFLKYLSVGCSPQKLPKPCLYLHTLVFHMNFSDQDEVITALCLLRSSPALKDLHIMSRQDKQAVVGEVNTWLEVNQDFLFTKLRFVKITSISGLNAELDFIRFLLSSSPVLERMTIMPAAGTNSSELLTKMIQFKQASTHAEIIYSET